MLERWIREAGWRRRPELQLHAVVAQVVIEFVEAFQPQFLFQLLFEIFVHGVLLSCFAFSALLLVVWRIAAGL